MSISECTIEPFEKCILDKWETSPNTTCYPAHLFARAACLVLTPVSLIVKAIEIILGVGATIGAVFTCMHEPTCAFAAKNLAAGSLQLLTTPYTHCLRAIHPNFDPPIPNESDSNAFGIVSGYTFEKLEKIMDKCSESENCLMHHVVSRLTCVVSVVVLLIVGAVDIVFGVLAAAFSIVALGTIQSLNRSAYKGFQGSIAICLLVLSTLLFINPSCKLPVRFSPCSA